MYEVVTRIKKCGYFEPDKTSAEGGNGEEEDGSSRASTPNGELSAGSSEEAQENTVQQQQVRWKYFLERLSNVFDLLCPKTYGTASSLTDNM